jgi:hypothetical protein
VALEKYKVIQEGGNWCKKSERDLEFIAMQTELKQLKQNSKEPSGPSKPRGGGQTNRNKGKFAWKGVAPKAGEPHEKTVNGKIYIYCPHHGDTKWVLKTNVKGIEHKTGCTKMAQGAAPPPTTATGGQLVAALADADESDNEENI